jgi:hypothetical protein
MRVSTFPEPSVSRSESLSGIDSWLKSPPTGFHDRSVLHSLRPYNEPGQTLAPYQRRALETLLQSGLKKEDIDCVSKLGVEGIERLSQVWEREGKEGMNSLLNPIKGIDSILLETSLRDMTRKLPSYGRNSLLNH